MEFFGEIRMMRLEYTKVGALVKGMEPEEMVSVVPCCSHIGRLSMKNHDSKEGRVETKQ